MQAPPAWEHLHVVTTTRPEPRGELLEQELVRLHAQCEEASVRVKQTIRRTRALRATLQATRTNRAADRRVVRAASIERRREAAGLTGRQHEVLLLIADGLATKAIARRLWLSPATVRNHVAAILL